jgi:hypothetical protein
MSDAAQPASHISLAGFHSRIREMCIRLCRHVVWRYGVTHDATYSAAEDVKDCGWRNRRWRGHDAVRVRRKLVWSECEDNASTRSQCQTFKRHGTGRCRWTKFTNHYTLCTASYSVERKGAVSSVKTGRTNLSDMLGNGKKRNDICQLIG